MTVETAGARTAIDNQYLRAMEGQVNGVDQVGQVDLKPIYGRSVSIERFEAALEQARAASGAQPVDQAVDVPAQPMTVAQVDSRVVGAPANGDASQAVTLVGGAVDGVVSDAEKSRALRGLDLDQKASEVPAVETGDTILDGLSRLRGVFDNQETAITSIADQPITSGNQLIGLQLEVVKYSMLMDVTSKLTGKSTQAFDTLMKGQ
ncbi:MAG: hypothetical protein AAGE61_14570 [Pseudomonadota bacterium]